MQSKENKMEAWFRSIIVKLGEDPNREGLQKTPARAAKALQELCSGYQDTLEKVINGAVYQAHSHDLVLVKDIELYSLCEHHMLPFIGRCHVGYIPDTQVIGLSKVARIVDMHAKRLQIQEGLTFEIAESLHKAIAPRGIAVTIEAEHLCVRMQGVSKQNSVMVTSSMWGVFQQNPELRAEYLALIKR